jgi:hypothetical protein
MAPPHYQYLLKNYLSAGTKPQYVCVLASVQTDAAKFLQWLPGSTQTLALPGKRCRQVNSALF